ncbi:hypothetical protein HMPREF2531_05387 [Bacteroides intestinalis]|uniref:Uncharacterized protein n=1 Tax=Bacteroides intestinalis TaxID=329854 RepID=A0A139KN75_9BACE|nr:hypothetical protein HMPREF2531_05387 [Bacteroides intestinalis]
MAKVSLSFSEAFKQCINLTDILCKIGCMLDNYRWFARWQIK